MTALIIGVDGGGTSTRCVVVSETGEVAGRGRAGGTNVISVADPAANLVAALRAAMDGLDPARVVGGVFGLAGSGAERAGRMAGEAWRSAGLPGHPSVVADVLVAFASATAEPDGMVLLAGTGAVAARITRWGVVRVADGHG
ncbi:MAG TPA: BadF/BadG/BcrA/BcrD ATPase family protein, partial [Trebonia sp.]